MASQQLQDLKLSVDQAEQIIDLGISFGAYDGDEKPDSKKEKLSAAQEIVAHSLDAWIDDEIRPDDEEADVAEAGEQIAKVFEIAGITVDDDGEVSYGEEEEDEDEGDNGDDASDEEPFDPDSYIEGYSELSTVTKLKKLRELDADDDDDVAVLEAIADWENEQDKPSSRVLSYIDDTLGTEEDPAAEEESEEDAEEDNGGDEESEDEPLDPPWEADRKNKVKAYDNMSAVEIKAFLKEVKDAGDLTADQVEYVLEYEQSREKPGPRKRVVDFAKALLEEFENGGDSEPADEEPEEAEKPKRRGRGRGKAKQAEPEADSNGTITLTREQILTALEEGQVEIKV